MLNIEDKFNYRAVLIYLRANALPYMSIAQYVEHLSAEDPNIDVTDATAQLFASVSRPPPARQQIVTAVKAITTTVLSGFATVDDAEYEKRIAFCDDCEHFKESRCYLCGCYMKVKAKLEAQRCPAEKW
jgi:hypothetical protein